MIPSPWVALVIALGVFRLVRLVGWDDFPPIYRLRSRLIGERVRFNQTESQNPIFEYDRPTLAKFLFCPWCQGFWLSLATYGAWLVRPSWALYGLAPLALSSVVGLISKNLDP